MIVAFRLEDIALWRAVHRVDLGPLLAETDGEHRKNDRDQKAGLDVGNDRRRTGDDPDGLEVENVNIFLRLDKVSLNFK